MNGKFVIHSDNKNEMTKERLKKARFISDNIDIAFKDKGIAELYTWAYLEEHDRYNLFLGFEPTGETIPMEDWFDQEVREYKKEL